jgi:hypothetical protein
VAASSGLLHLRPARFAGKSRISLGHRLVAILKLVSAVRVETRALGKGQLCGLLTPRSYFGKAVLCKRLMLLIVHEPSKWRPRHFILFAQSNIRRLGMVVQNPLISTMHDERTTIRVANSFVTARYENPLTSTTRQQGNAFQ